MFLGWLVWSVIEEGIAIRSVQGWKLKAETCASATDATERGGGGWWLITRMREDQASDRFISGVRSHHSKSHFSPPFPPLSAIQYSHPSDKNGRAIRWSDNRTWTTKLQFHTKSPSISLHCGQPSFSNEIELNSEIPKLYQRHSQITFHSPPAGFPPSRLVRFDIRANDIFVCLSALRYTLLTEASSVLNFSGTVTGWTTQQQGWIVIYPQSSAPHTLSLVHTRYLAGDRLLNILCFLTITIPMTASTDSQKFRIPSRTGSISKMPSHRHRKRDRGQERTWTLARSKPILENYFSTKMVPKHFIPSHL